MSSVDDFVEGANKIEKSVAVFTSVFDPAVVGDIRQMLADSTATSQEQNKKLIADVTKVIKPFSRLTSSYVYNLFIGGVFVALCAGFFLGTAINYQPILEKANADLRERSATLEKQSADLSAEKAQLEKQKKVIAQDQKELEKNTASFSKNTATFKIRKYELDHDIANVSKGEHDAIASKRFLNAIYDDKLGVVVFVSTDK